MAAIFSNEGRGAVDQMVSLAHLMIENGNSEAGNRLLAIAREMRGLMLSASVPPKSVLQNSKALFDDLGIEFAVIGGMAMAAYGNARGTEDIDFLVSELPVPMKVGSSDYMRSFGFRKGKSRTGKHMVLDHDKGMIELLPVLSDGVRKRALMRAKPMLTMGNRVPVASVEDMLALKAYAATSSERSADKRRVDRSDIQHLLETQNPVMNKVLGLGEEQKELLERIQTAVDLIKE